MADHKAPTEVTVVVGDEPSRLALFVDRHWIKGALVALVVAAGILVYQYRSVQEAEAFDQSWSRLMSAVDESAGFKADPSALQALEGELKGTQAGAWALYLKAEALRDEGRYGEAIASLQAIKQQYPEHPLVRDRRTYGDAVTPLSTIEYLSKVYASEQTWREKRPELYANPEVPAGSPRVRFQTDRGDFVVALYADLAPKHVENFLAKVNEGFYEGLKFHRTAFGQMIETGDPTTRDPESDPMNWGRQGSEDSIEAEENGLSHFPGVLSANKLGAEEGSNGGLIAITVQPAHYRDGTNVVFGAVVEGMGVVEEIANLPRDQTGQRPVEPTTIQSATVLPGA